MKKPNRMTAKEFKYRQGLLGYKNDQMAYALGVSVSTIEKWRSESHQIPKTAGLLLRKLTEGKENDQKDSV